MLNVDPVSFGAVRVPAQQQCLRQSLAYPEQVVVSKAIVCKAGSVFMGDS